MPAELKVQEVLGWLETWAPAHTAADWDRVGLQIGARDSVVKRILVSLEAEPEVVEETAKQSGTLLVTHHPLLFRPIERLEPGRSAGALAAKLLVGGAAYIACHTNWDQAPGGTDDALADAVGLPVGADRTPLVPVYANLYEVRTAVPEDRAEAVWNAAVSAGAGSVGAYREAGLVQNAEERYVPVAGAKPAFGAEGEAVRRPTTSLTWVVEAQSLSGVQAAIRKAHPYEEPYLTAVLSGARRRGGAGRVADVPENLTVAEWAKRVSERLNAEVVRAVGDSQRKVRRVAVVGGAGTSFMRNAVLSRAELLITADVSHHVARDAESLGIVLIDGGHRATERPGVEALYRRIEAAVAGRVPVQHVPVRGPFWPL